MPASQPPEWHPLIQAAAPWAARQHVLRRVLEFERADARSACGGAGRFFRGANAATTFQSQMPKIVFKVNEQVDENQVVSVTCFMAWPPALAQVGHHRPSNRWRRPTRWPPGARGKFHCSQIILRLLCQSCPSRPIPMKKNVEHLAIGPDSHHEAMSAPGCPRPDALNCQRRLAGRFFSRPTRRKISSPVGAGHLARRGAGVVSCVPRSTPWSPPRGEIARRTIFIRRFGVARISRASARRGDRKASAGHDFVRVGDRRGIFCVDPPEQRDVFRGRGGEQVHLHGRRGNRTTGGSTFAGCKTPARAPGPREKESPPVRGRFAGVAASGI